MLPPKYVLLVSLVALLSFFHLGCDVAIPLSAATIRRDFDLTSHQHTEVVNVAGRASVFGAIVSGLVLNYSGRWGMIVLGLCLHVAGVVLTCVGPTYEALMTGRVLTGLSFGFGLTAGPIYVAEIAPANYRGFLISLSQLLFTVGQVLGYLAQYLIGAHIGARAAWRVVIAVGALPSLVAVAFLRAFLPESPCSLILRGRVGEANGVMTRCGVDQSERTSRSDELKHLARLPPAAAAATTAPPPSIFAILRRMWPELLMPTLPVYFTIVFVALLQSFPPLSGADVAVRLGRGYWGRIGDEPLTYYLKAEILSVGLRAVVSLFPILMADRIGRRRVLIISILVTVAATGCLGVVGELNHHGILGEESASLSCVGLQVVLQMGHGIGLGAVSWIYGPESFHFLVRAPAVGLGVAMNQAVVAAVAANLGRWYAKFDKGGVFCMCCGVMLFALVSCSVFFRDRTRLALVEAVVPAARRS